MKRLLSVLLILVVMLSCAHYAAADTLSKYDAWLSSYDFDSILADLDSGKSEIVGQAKFKIRDASEICKDMFEDFNLGKDEFTGEIMLTHSLLKEFTKNCQVYPFIDESGLNLYVGFPYSNAMHYDKIYLNVGDKIIEYSRFDNEHGFDIQFERLNGKSWEYSLLTSIDFPVDNLYSVSFREKGSVSKVDYVLTENEMIAVNALNFLQHKINEIRLLVQSATSQGE